MWNCLPVKHLQVLLRCSLTCQMAFLWGKESQGRSPLSCRVTQARKGYQNRAVLPGLGTQAQNAPLIQNCPKPKLFLPSLKKNWSLVSPFSLYQHGFPAFPPAWSSLRALQAGPAVEPCHLLALPGNTDWLGATKGVPNSCRKGWPCLWLHCFHHGSGQFQSKLPTVKNFSPYIQTEFPEAICLLPLALPLCIFRKSVSTFSRNIS